MNAPVPDSVEVESWIALYFDVHWVASFYGEKPEKVQRYASRVRKRAETIRDGVRERGLGRQ
ncbi:hypothetical protein EGH21_01020 [Halomicroarcula sp. F13]|uniref:Uncharacterized protein n=1 Tax=Haloarcula rubra TaxID=2487747 RepID=A0AAW4PLV0_9EURY|nr:hypothetical protein [Halomicroarcula rubra]MBX0321600.1 hypothetical protein [Halomicroarcula rubra]